MTWTTPTQIPGQSTKEPPALATFNNGLHMVHLGETSNDIWYSVSADGIGWSQNVTIPGQKSKQTPALAAFGGQLHMVHLGDTSNDIWHSVFTGGGWSQNVRIEGQKSKRTPALADFDGELHMVHLGDEEKVIWHATYNGDRWSLNAPITQQFSKEPPALAAFGGRLHMVHLGDTSNDIWYAQFDNSRLWTVNVRAPQHHSHAPPAIAPLGTRLHMLHQGENSTGIYHSSSDGTLSVIRVGFKVVVPPVTSINAFISETQRIFGSVGFTIEEAAARETLTVPVDLRDLDIDECIIGTTSSEQNELFTHRNNLGPRDIAVYIVDALPPKASILGCATHPDAVPAVVLEARNAPAALAHELGHVLGIHHVDDPNNLMLPNIGWTNYPPDLTLGQALTVESSSYSRE